jgi:hypothetical protein
VLEENLKPNLYNANKYGLNLKVSKYYYFGMKHVHVNKPGIIRKNATWGAIDSRNQLQEITLLARSHVCKA